MQSGTSDDLPAEWLARANELHELLCVDLGIVHQVAYRLRANAKEIAALRAALTE